MGIPDAVRLGQGANPAMAAVVSLRFTGLLRGQHG